MNSRAKGCRGEREFRDILRAAGFCKAYRTQQYSGKTGQACDVTCPELPSIHFEVKRVERGNPYEWLGQANSECNEKIPIVAHKRNNYPWIAVLNMTDLLQLLTETDRVK